MITRLWAKHRYFSKCLFFIALLTSLFISCKKTNNVTTDKGVRLRFSADSMLFDTIFTGISSVTKRLKVFNNANQAIRISKINLEGKSNSFTLNINGKALNTDTDIELKAKDSLYIFVKALINSTSAILPFIVSDSISFLTNDHRQIIHLEAYGQNANVIKDSELKENTIWTNTLPYIIYNSITVGENSILTIEKGAQIYFHKDSRMLVAGTLVVNGELNNPVNFGNDRRETLYQDEPGQWQGIEFQKSSKNNKMNYCILKNALFGLQVNSLSNGAIPDLILTNSIVKNMQSSALILNNTSVAAFNNLIYNCGQYLIYAAAGGDYEFKQNTFVAFNYNFLRYNPALSFSTYDLFKPSSTANPLKLNLTNNIIWGSFDSELLIDQKNINLTSVAINNNLVKDKSGFVINDSNLQNIDPSFVNSKKEDYRLSAGSPAKLKGANLSTDHYFNSYLSKTLDGNARTFPSNLGCF